LYYCVRGDDGDIHNHLRVVFVIVRGRRVVDAANCEGFHSFLLL
jgi:hypothetical protein